MFYNAVPLRNTGTATLGVAEVNAELRQNALWRGAIGLVR